VCYTTVYHGISALTLTYTTLDSCITYTQRWNKVDRVKEKAGSRGKVREAHRKERSVIHREDDVGGRAKVTSNEERLLWGG